MPDDRIGIQLGHPGRADHDRRCAGFTRVPAVRDAGARAFRGRSCDHPDAPLHLVDDRLQYPATFSVVEPCDLAGDAERRHAVHARADEEVDDFPEAELIKIAVRLKRRGQDGINAFELQGGFLY